ncbi:MAG: transcriptional activator NhaR [Deltaproteobacteria bacterium]|nr:transcriptional activator NhaR [Deltaproteobacteria bacterium]MBW2421065.1 transcriptional activator NhaR [Deltaproteobacteria bacterium]
MEWLNYHHLLYFWTVAREGSVSKASASLRLAQPTISGQVKTLEDSLGEKLFERRGRNLVLTEMGEVVFRYADEIFSLGRELLNTVKSRPAHRPARLKVGLAGVVPKLIAYELLKPALALPEPVELSCIQDDADRLVVALATYSLDVVLTDAPLGRGLSVRAYNHFLGESGVTFFGTKALAAKYRRGFPRSLDGAPFLLPMPNTTVRGGLDQWFEKHAIWPRLAAQFDDTALLKVFGGLGIGVFPAPTVIEAHVKKQYGVSVIGRTTEVMEQFYAISVERRITHPAVREITAAARSELFG